MCDATCAMQCYGRGGPMLERATIWPTGRSCLENSHWADDFRQVLYRFVRGGRTHEKLEAFALLAQNFKLNEEPPCLGNVIDATFAPPSARPALQPRSHARSMSNGADA